MTDIHKEPSAFEFEHLALYADQIEKMGQALLERKISEGTELINLADLLRTDLGGYRSLHDVQKTISSTRRARLEDLDALAQNLEFLEHAQKTNREALEKQFQADSGSNAASAS